MKKQRTEEEMGRVLSAFDGSGQSMRKFCATSGMAEYLLPLLVETAGKRSWGFTDGGIAGLQRTEDQP